MGKAHLAISLAATSCDRGLKAHFTTMEAFIRKLKKSEFRQKAYLAFSLVIVDVVGCLPFNCQEAHLFFQFVSHCYERYSPIITSNKGFGGWQELFEDAVLAAAILGACSIPARS